MFSFFRFCTNLLKDLNSTLKHILNDKHNDYLYFVAININIRFTVIKQNWILVRISVLLKNEVSANTSFNNSIYYILNKLFYKNIYFKTNKKLFF